ncbi:hypothetical protein BKA62DRAFT_452621 [Auriculariales sp. MPI-PUGE-AT-0066]|nr:hypothetical protein BKA62DRAFT_452621 [Auriculariales sp. MPI-PUGE-AT-0066]
MNHPNNPLTLPLPPSQTFSPRSSASAPIGTSPISDVESSVGAASGRPTDHVLLSMIRAYVDARAANTPSAAAAPDATDVTEEQDRNAKEAAEFKKDCPWEETPEKRYPALNPEYYTEFEKKYPPDLHGEEASPNARVWRVYRDRVTELDGDLLQGWHKTLDVLLIFVGLFSVIAAAFIIEVSKSLQPDYGEITARGVVALLAQTNASFAAPLPIPSFDRVDASTRALWTNALWFASLTLALIDALLIILVKQWLVEYASKQRQPAASGQTWAWRHHAFRQGLDKWGIGVFISTLSVIIYGALYLFLFGLLVFIFDLDRRLCVVSMGLTILIGGLHLVSVFLPLWFGDCPTTTPELTHLRWIGAFSKHAVMRVWVHSMSAIGRLRQQMIRYLLLVGSQRAQRPRLPHLLNQPRLLHYHQRPMMDHLLSKRMSRFATHWYYHGCSETCPQKMT